MEGSKSAGDPNPRLGSSKSASVFGWGIQIRGDPNPRLHLQQKAEAWVQEVSRLTEIAATQPQAAYSVFVHGLKHKWTFLSRVMSDVDAAMAPVEAAVVDGLIPALSGRPVSLVERELLALPCRHGGMGLTKPTSLGSQYISSRRVSAPISSRIAQQIGALGDSLIEVRAIKRKVASDGRNGSKAEATILAASLEPDMQHVISLASEKGSSSWLTCRPLDRHGFSLSKGEFRDAICLRYNWLPPRLPSSCCCGRQFDISHALSCPTGGFPLCAIMRFVTPLRSCSRESPTTSRLSLICCLWQARPSDTAQPSQRIRLVSTWRLVVCGVDGSNALLLMSGFLTLLRLRTVPPRSPLPTHDMRKRRGGRMRSELGWWSTRLLCQPSSRRQVEWGRLLLHYTRESPPCCPRRPVRHTAPQWPGSGAGWASRYWGPALWASVGLVACLALQWTLALVPLLLWLRRLPSMCISSTVRVLELY